MPLLLCCPAHPVFIFVEVGQLHASDGAHNQHHALHDGPWVSGDLTVGTYKLVQISLFESWLLQQVVVPPKWFLLVLGVQAVCNGT